MRLIKYTFGFRSVLRAGVHNAVLDIFTTDVSASVKHWTFRNPITINLRALHRIIEFHAKN